MKYAIVIILGAFFMVSCSSSITRGAQYPKMYEEKPASIVVMPPINQTNSVEAKDYFYTTMYIPLCEKGYYVFSPYLTMEMMQTESAYDSEMFLTGSLEQFKNVLGADAAMFTIIKSWQKSTVGGKITVGVEYVLRSTTSGETLYNREGLITVDTSINTGGGLLGSLVNLAATAINTALTDKIVAGRMCNVYVLSDMPVGVYNPSFEKDINEPAGGKYIKATVK